MFSCSKFSLSLTRLSQEKKRMNNAKIKTWVRTFAEKHELWFQCHDELRIPSIDDMEPSYIDGKMFIDINRFHDITLGVFEFIREDIEEEEWTSVDTIRFFVLQSSDFSNEEALYAGIIRESKKYIQIEPEYITLVEKND